MKTIFLVIAFLILTPILSLANDEVSNWVKPNKTYNCKMVQIAKADEEYNILGGWKEPLGQRKITITSSYDLALRINNGQEFRRISKLHWASSSGSYLELGRLKYLNFLSEFVEDPEAKNFKFYVGMYSCEEE